MTNIYEIDLKQVVPKLQKLKEYNIYTLYKDIPVNVKTKLLWIDVTANNEFYIAFDWKNVSMKYAFQSDKPVYIKISIPYNSKELSFYIKCDIFSGMRDELVLMANSLVEAPPFLSRASIRVEIDDKIPASANICIEETNECIENLKIKNISETGFAITIQKDEDSNYINFLEKMKEYVNKEIKFNVTLNIDKDVINVVAHLVNLYDESNNVIAGFKMNVNKKDVPKLASFIMKRQQQIIQEIKTL